MKLTYRELVAAIDRLMKLPACDRDPCHCIAVFAAAEAPDLGTWADDDEAVVCNPGGLPVAV